MPHPATVSFQFYAPGDDAPTCGYEITKASLQLPAGAQIPRVGEFLTYSLWKESDDLMREQFVVLAVNTSVTLFNEAPEDVGWHTVITVGPAEMAADQRLLIIAS